MKRLFQFALPLTFLLCSCRSVLIEEVVTDPPLEAGKSAIRLVGGRKKVELEGGAFGAWRWQVYDDFHLLRIDPYKYPPRKEIAQGFIGIDAGPHQFEIGCNAESAEGTTTLEANLREGHYYHIYGTRRKETADVWIYDGTTQEIVAKGTIDRFVPNVR